MHEETVICPICGCNKFFTVSFAVDPKDEFYECAYCKAIFGYEKIRGIFKRRKDSIMAKGTPKKDGSGGGNRSNRGRGGCKTTRPKGKGKN